jgi:hypothetical protein
MFILLQSYSCVEYLVTNNYQSREKPAQNQSTASLGYFLKIATSVCRGELA